jgi:hypothetical protein
VQYSDGCQLWQALLPEPELLAQKQLYNPSFEVQSVRDLARLLVKLFRAPEAQVRSRQTPEYVLISCELQLDIYPFLWKFHLYKSDRPPREVALCLFLQPLAKIIGSLEEEARRASATADLL